MPIAVLIVGPAATADTAARPHADLLRMPFPEDEGSLTPYDFGRAYSLLTLVYDTVMWRDAAGVPQPWLARDLVTSADEQAVTIHVASGARWQDGPPVTATDIAFSFRYFITHPQPRFTPELDAAAAFDTPDANTVVVHLKRPAQGFIEEALCDLPIIPEHIWAASPGGSPQSGLAVGSGPYRLVTHQGGRLYRFTAMPDYFRGPPAVTTIDVPIINEASATLEALERHTVDALPFSLSSDQAALLRNQIGVRLDTGPSYVGTALMLNTRLAPFDRASVRQAVAEAIDLGALTSAVGGGVPAERGYLHPDSGWAPESALHHLDLSHAHRTLSAVGDGSIELLAPDNDSAQAAAGKEVAVALSRAGLAARERLVSVAALDHVLGADGSTPTFDMAIVTSPALASLDPGLLVRLFGSNASLNFAGYASTAFDAAADRTARAPDPASRHAAVADELRQLAADAPVVPLFFPRGTYAVRPGAYDGWVFAKGTGILDKLSFVDPASDRAAGASSAPTAAPSSSAPSALGWSALGLLALAVLVGVTQIVRRRVW